jgi:hypothetical protein
VLKSRFIVNAPIAACSLRGGGGRLRQLQFSDKLLFLLT